MHNRSSEAFAAASAVLVGGVNSPVRAFRAVGGEPRFIARAQGARVWDVDANEYIDFVGSWGTAILGHAPDAVVAAIGEAAACGTSFGAPTIAETELALLIREAVPSMERLRLVNSGTEATMSALRVARGVTGREKILKFNGGYHGHVDALLVRAGSGALTGGAPDSAGIPAAVAAQTLVAEYNQRDQVEALFAAHGDAIAAVIVEPVAGNMGCVLPRPGFLEGLRTLCTAHGALLIFDEVMTGFRVAHGGAQQYFHITPDITCLGKIIGGGLPVGAYGGREEIMRHVAPLGPVYQAGTLSGNPLAMAAGIATLRALQLPDVYETLHARSRALTQGLAAVCATYNIPCRVSAIGGMWGIFFTGQPVHTLADVMTSDATVFRKFFHAMLAQGIYLAPSPYEAGFVSLAHTEADIVATISAAEKCFAGRV